MRNVATAGFIKEMKEHGIVNPYKDMMGIKSISDQ